MSDVYQVANWGQFENHKSRERDELKFFLVPNEQTTKLNLLLSHKNGAAVYGIHHLILCIASRQKQGSNIDRRRNGWLTHDGTQEGQPYTPKELAVLVKRPAREVAHALEFLSDPKIGWIVKHATCAAVSKPDVPLNLQPAQRRAV